MGFTKLGHAVGKRLVENQTQWFGLIWPVVSILLDYLVGGVGGQLALMVSVEEVLALQPWCRVSWLYSLKLNYTLH